MRSEDGKHFESVIGVTDHAADTGEEFQPNVLDFENPMAVGNIIITARGDKFEYRGEDSLGRSIFTAPGRPISEAVFGSK
jgi:hypothetical protein